MREERKGFNSVLPPSTWFHSPPVSLLTQAALCSTQYRHRATDMRMKYQIVALLLPAAWLLFTVPSPCGQGEDW